MKTIGILGSTGSIGMQAIEVVKKFKDYQIEYLSCFSNADKIIEQAKEIRPKKVCIVNSDLEKKVCSALKGENIQVLSGYQGIYELAKQKVSLLLNSIVGADGMEPSILALERNIPLALANKESIVMAGWIISDIKKRLYITVSFVFKCIVCIKKQSQAYKPNPVLW